MSNTTATVITLDTLITVPDAYFPDAVWNLAAVVWGWPLNIFILYAGLGPRVKGRFKYAIIGMTACQLYGTVGETLLYTLYFVFQQTKTPITVLQCSVVRRVLQVTVNPPTMSILVSSIHPKT
uniref:G protein-coupled receptor n=1 Tax=Panagrellus redivivus TaxID=6233 RepID=A0A7E4ZQX7_PANRE